MKKIAIIFALIVLTVPVFARMLRPGIFSTQDFHFFRLYEFDKCVKAGQIPCRWAPDAGLGYGEPLFNFYAQLPYAVGELFHLAGLSLIDTTKLLFILSLVLSALSMYLFANSIWKNKWAAVISSLVYVYAPYRSVDVWVRGALPEALSFIFFPLIIYFIDKVFDKNNLKNTILLGITLAATLLTHNLSLLMFSPFIIVWIIFRLLTTKKFTVIYSLFISAVVALLLSSFYILPVIFESKYVDLVSTTTGYFDFRAHFVTVSQLFVSRFWGYGGSTWGPDDGLSLSIGQVQWIVPMLILPLFNFGKKFKNKKEFLVFFTMAILYLFLTHNKSTFIWTAISPMKYIQFPWRFLTIALFCLSIASGMIVSLVSKEKLKTLLTAVILASLIFLNFSFFKEDIWYNFTDYDLTNGQNFIEQTRASIGDYWPLFGHQIPSEPSNGEFINYFPGWKVKENGSLIDAKPNSEGLIPAEGSVFTDTPVRRVGNIISLTVLVLVLAAYPLSYKLKLHKS